MRRWTHGLTPRVLQLLTSRNHPTAKTPLPASSYLERYYDEEARPQFKSLIQELEAYPLIDEAILTDLSKGHKTFESGNVSSQASGHPAGLVTSLDDIAADKVIQNAIQQGRNQQISILEAPRPPGRRSAVKKRLYGMAEKPTSWNRPQQSLPYYALFCVARDMSTSVPCSTFPSLISAPSSRSSKNLGK